jgi:predicted O-methyltransferase YrrM
MNLDDLLIKKHRGCYLKILSLIYQIEIKTIVEIGVFRGKNATVLREVFPKAHLYLIDPWTPSPAYLHSGTAVSREQKVFDEAYARVKTVFQNDPHVHLIKKTAEEAAPTLPNTFDLVFIDANHAYAAVKNHILTWRQKVRPGGMLSGHNYGRNRLPGVKKAVDEIFGDHFLLGQDEVWAKILKIN